MKQLKELEEENQKLKHMYAELALDLKLAKGIIEKNLKPCQKKQIVQEVKDWPGVSISRECRIFPVQISAVLCHNKG